MRSTYEPDEGGGAAITNSSQLAFFSSSAAPGTRKLLLLRRSEDLRPTLLAFVFVLYQVMVFAMCTEPLEALLLVAVPHFLLQVALMNVQHISIHHRLFQSRNIELGFCGICSLSLGFTRCCFALDHLAHHRNYLNPALDPNACLGDTGAFRRHRYAVRHLLTIYPRTWRMARNAGAEVRKEYVTECAVVLLLCAFFVLLKPAIALAVFIYPMIYNIVATFYWAHHQHAGLETTSPHLASRTFDSPVFNWLSFNVGYHAAHHHRPEVHWSRLPALHETLRAHIPANLTLHTIPWFSSEYSTHGGPR